jgi:hypothetical protein
MPSLIFLFRSEALLQGSTWVCGLPQQCLSEQGLATHLCWVTAHGHAMKKSQGALMMTLVFQQDYWHIRYIASQLIFNPDGRCSLLSECAAGPSAQVHHSLDLTTSLSPRMTMPEAPTNTPIYRRGCTKSEGHIKSGLFSKVVLHFDSNTLVMLQSFEIRMRIFDSNMYAADFGDTSAARLESSLPALSC